MKLIRSKIELKNIAPKIGTNIRKCTDKKILIVKWKMKTRILNKKIIDSSNIKGSNTWLKEANLQKKIRTTKITKKRKIMSIDPKDLLDNTKIEINKEISSPKINKTINLKATLGKDSKEKKGYLNQHIKSICMEIGSTERKESLSPKILRSLKCQRSYSNYQMKLLSINNKLKLRRRLKSTLSR